MSKEIRLFTPRARLAWPFLFTPRAEDADGKPIEPKYSLKLLFDVEAQKTPEWKALVAAIVALGREKFKDAMGTWQGPGKGQVAQVKTAKGLLAAVDMPFRDGSDVTDEDGNPRPGYGPGVVYFGASSKYKPGVVGGDKQALVEGDVYAGCYVRASLVPFAFENAGNKGISWGLRNVQKMADGQPFGQGIKAEDEFGEVQGYQAPERPGSEFPPEQAPGNRPRRPESQPAPASTQQGMGADSDDIPF